MQTFCMVEGMSRINMSCKHCLCQWFLH